MTHDPDRQTARTLVHVAESALALLKAELRALVAQNRPFVAKVVLGLACLVAGVLLAQVSVLLLAVAPLLIDVRPLWTIALAVASTAVPSVVCFWFARKSFGAARFDSGNRKSSPAARANNGTGTDPSAPQRGSIAPSPNQVDG